MAVSSTTGGLRTGVCLSTDRPQNPYNGQVIYETDTNRTLVWDNSAWVVVADPALVSFSGSAASVTGNLTGNVTGDVTGDLTGDVAASAVTIGGENVTPYTGRKNAVVNGDMKIAQRGTSTTFSSGGGAMYYACDRFGVDNYNWSGGGQITLAQESSITPPGFSNSLKVSIGSTALVYGSGGYTAVKYSIEGYDASRFYDGNATLSFWVRSSIAGTYSILVANNWWGTGSADRGLILEYEIDQANTWEKKSVVIDFASGTSAGTWGATNSYGVLLQWFLGANANRIGDTYLNSWANWSAYEVMSSNATNWGTNANATFYLTGVQLEVGDKATPFEHRSYGEELALCQRYYEKSYDVGTAPGTATDSGFILAMPGGAQASSSGIHDAYILFRTTKRTNATVSIYDNAGNINKCRRTTVGVANYDNQSVTDVNGYTNGVYFRSSSGSAATHTVSCHFTASAEL